MSPINKTGKSSGELHQAAEQEPGKQTGPTDADPGKPDFDARDLGIKTQRKAAGPKPAQKPMRAGAAAPSSDKPRNPEAVIQGDKPSSAKKGKGQ